MVERWMDAAWRAEVDAWIAGRLAERGLAISGPIEQPHVRRWATVLRVPTASGAVFFKANEPALRHEAAVVEFVSARHPDLVPAPLAIDRERGWLLMADAGTRLRELVSGERDLARWLDILPRYARLQIDLARDADTLIELGLADLRLSRLPEAFDGLIGEMHSPAVGDGTGLSADEIARLDVAATRLPALCRELGLPDLRLSRLPEAFDGLLRELRSAAVGDGAGLTEDELGRLDDAATRLPALCRELAAFAIPETIQHDDLNDGQVFVRDDVPRLLDWADACVSHPFFSLSVALEGVIQWGVDDIEGSVDTAPFRDAYLAPFAREWPRSDLREAVRIALRLGWACRAVNGRPPDGLLDAATGARLRMFLDGRA